MSGHNICLGAELVPKLSFSLLFSLPGQSPGRAIVLPPALALALASGAAAALAKC